MATWMCSAESAKVYVDRLGLESFNHRVEKLIKAMK